MLNDGGARVVIRKLLMCEQPSRLPEPRVVNSGDTGGACLKGAINGTEPGNPRLDTQLPTTEFVPDPFLREASTCLRKSPAVVILEFSLFCHACPCDEAHPVFCAQ